jgi:3-deoxy-7-phosphoheptulonate synthase
MDKPVLLKRGLSATIEEMLSAAEYILKGGNREVLLCERGIRTFETYTRNTLDLAAVASLKQLTHLPVIVDPSHATGRRDLVSVMSQAGIVAGADGIMVEVHQDPEHAKCDGPQSLTPADFVSLMQGVRPLLALTGKSIGWEE